MSLSIDKLHARHLLALKRPADAETAARQALAESPNDAEAHALLGFALYQQEQNPAALREAELAIGLAPDVATYHYARALILLALDRRAEAQTAIREALRLDPTQAAYHGVQSRIHLLRKEWQAALQAAEEGLRCDPEDVGCTNLRARALLQLGRGAEAAATIETALRHDPENPATHANQGWALLQRGEHRAALEHFREALRRDPMSMHAREGIVEALKARNPLYRWLLRYFLWMTRFTVEERLAVHTGIAMVRQGLHAVAAAFWPLWLVVLPLDMLYRGFITFTWIGDPLFALALRFHRFGRLALPPRQIAASNGMAACLLTAEFAVLAGLLLRSWAFGVLALVALALILPVAGIFHCRKTYQRVLLSLYTTGLLLVGLGAFGLALWNTVWGWGLAALAGLAFMSGLGFYPLAASLLFLVDTLYEESK